MDKSNERIIFKKHIIFLFFIVYSIDRSSAVIHPPILLRAMSAQWGFFPPLNLKSEQAVRLIPRLNQIVLMLIQKVQFYLFYIWNKDKNLTLMLGVIFSWVLISIIIIVQSLSHVWLCDPVDCSMKGFPVLHYLLEFAQVHAH